MIYHARSNSLDGLPQAVRNTTKALREHRGEFDAMIATGLSGVIVAVPAHMRTNIPLLILRKPGEKSHGNEYVNYDAIKKGSRVVFVDDFTSMGVTRQRCREAVEKCGGTLVAQFLYSDAEWSSL